MTITLNTGYPPRPPIEPTKEDWWRLSAGEGIRSRTWGIPLAYYTGPEMASLSGIIRLSSTVTIKAKPHRGGKGYRWCLIRGTSIALRKTLKEIEDNA